MEQMALNQISCACRGQNVFLPEPSGYTNPLRLCALDNHCAPLWLMQSGRLLYNCAGAKERQINEEGPPIRARKNTLTKAEAKHIKQRRMQNL
jgi:hypothetical protein